MERGRRRDSEIDRVPARIKISITKGERQGERYLLTIRSDGVPAGKVIGGTPLGSKSFFFRSSSDCARNGTSAVTAW